MIDTGKWCSYDLNTVNIFSLSKNIYKFRHPLLTAMVFHFKSLTFTIFYA